MQSNVFILSTSNNIYLVLNFNIVETSNLSMYGTNVHMISTY